ncbi:MAG: hypothetical protein A2087_06000 [Spirochaetes bacterium GWD1_61_31]|nr:MAG: hypothetical protein A2Y37_05665 [Spirochaetes bacterium GWB1_60_80]OHD34403.1 MAG: hypothetical protein A2004_07020 [Spirochaetes bacterium GWC1_61_12]OHD35668.1 MAG: hypothetical protein A2087_06000 [Spirochaetes bacterium GWD1_61_31]OHD41646.1 MAG: hypothetical protein A2Y35_08885 [Spirochaetes bacterium GWE1_60_18]
MLDMNNRKCCAIAVLLLCTLLPSGADDGVRFELLGMKDGMANASVSCMVQDGAGFLWLGTQGGLHRYDGTAFTVYQNEPFDTTSLPHNLIQTMFLDNDRETIWLGTYGGLVRFDSRYDRFTSWTHRADEADSLINDIVITIARDAAGRLWAGTIEGLCRLDEASGRFTRYTSTAPQNDILASGVIRSLLLDSRGDFWVGTSGGGLFRYDPDSDDFSHLGMAADPSSGLPSNHVMSVREDNNGILWFGCWLYGLASWDRATDRWHNYPLDDNRVYFVNVDDPAYAYAGSWGGGLFALHKSSGRIENFRQGSGGPSSLSHDTAYSMLRDSAGNTWIGTNGGGLNRLSRLPPGLKVYEHDPADPTTRSAGRTAAILQDSRGRLWVGTHNSGLSMQQPGSDRFTRFRYDAANPSSLPNDVITCLYEDSRHNIWVLSNAGIARYLEDGSGFEVTRKDSGRPESLPDDIVYAMLEEPGSGNFWIGTYTAGLAYWDRTTDRFIRYPSVQDQPDSLSNNLVRALVYDSRGRLWIATNDGLNRYNGDGTFHRYMNEPDNYRSLPSKNLQSLFVDSLGNLWIASNGGGLVLYMEESDTFRYWTRRDGLPSNVVHSVLEDADGNLWISTTAGLAIMDRRTTLLRPYLAFSDLRFRDFSTGGYRDSKGLLYFGTLNALYRIDSSQSTPVVSPAPLRLTAIDYVTASDEPRPAPWYVDSLRLSWRQNAVSFTFALLDYREQAGNQYAYRLAGFDTEWQYPGSRNYASYTNLPGGDYEFMVRAANNDGTWSELATTIRLSVQAPPWLRWWALGLYLVALAVVVLSLVSLRGRLLLKSRVDELSSLKESLEQANARLLDISSHDDLTGLWNRRHFDTQLNLLTRQAVDQHQPLSLLMIDLDLFKQYNENYGYLEGDRCLARLSSVISTVCHVDLAELSPATTALVARYAAEELVILLPGTPGDQARQLAESIRQAVLGLQIENGSTGQFLTVSLGLCSMLPTRVADAHRLLDLAESALYRAKQAGRNRVELQL